MFAPGNVKSHLPNLLQPVSNKQDPPRGSRTSWNPSLSETNHRDKLTIKAVCTAHSLRSRERWEELSDIAMAARWIGDVFEATGGPILPS